MHTIKSKICELDIKFREVPSGSYETADALVFFTETSEVAIACRNSLLDHGVGTKILPEAITWHFAGSWEHMPSIINVDNNKKSLSYLSRAVSIPITVNMNKKLPSKIFKALQLALN